MFVDICFSVIMFVVHKIYIYFDSHIYYIFITMKYLVTIKQKLFNCNK